MKGLLAAALVLCAGTAAAQGDWDAPQAPFTVHGSTNYVGTAGISALLITSPAGHILIDGTTVAGAKVVAANIRTLGYDVRDIRYILSSHAHGDHAGGIAALQKASGARVLAGTGNVETLRTGVTPRQDPQFGTLSPFPGSARVGAVRDGEVVKLGPLALTAHSTPGHTPGGTTWTWRSCEKDKCLNMVFADSVTAVAAEGFRFSRHPELIAQFRRSFEAMAQLPCDIAIAAHPEVNALWGRLERAAREGSAAYADTGSCRAIADAGRKRLDDRLSQEKR
ncbi:SMB-1 family subclass B3 metallo-beta-lactamase [Caenimonas sp. DR4.4]|uniref:SMB-1 family subclass B3 metallo-beta-lactamase n=2 Tax=Caenimonas aquaedulcis TaxID=2793270 RepID=A0A931H3B4_9BURK|nr:SMB-1 family subclass B3 metallo-beta-lactamase [Caenimonas aquaedulcis]